MKKSIFTLLIMMVFGSVSAQNYESYYEQFWDHNVHANNATVTAALYIDDVLQTDLYWEIGAYDITTDEIVGGILGQQGNIGYPIYFLLYNGEAGDQITFRLYNHDSEQEMPYVCSNTFVFAPDGQEGTPGNPYPLYFYSEGQDFVFTGQGGWNDLNRWNADRLPMSLDHVTIASGAICNMPEEAIGTYADLTIQDGAQLFAPVDAQINATVEKEIAPYTNGCNNWYMIAAPVQDFTSESYANAGLLNEGYDLYTFDQDYMDEVYEEDEDTWVNGEWRNYRYYEAGGVNLDGDEYTVADFEPLFGGYLYANSQGTTLRFTGNLVTDEDYATARLLMSRNAGARTKGFNLVGNPYACNAAVTAPSSNSKIAGYYMMNVEGGENGARSEVVTIENPVVAPATALFVVVTANNNAGGVVTFTPTQNEANVRGINNPVINIEVRSDNGSLEDRAYVRMYECDNLVKFNLNNNSTKIFIPQNGESYAAAYAGESKAMPICFTSNNGGIHTITVNAENMNCSYLHLIDNVTGADIDLLRTPKYSFNAEDSNYATRFKLVFDEQATNEIIDNFAFISNGELMINNSGNATLQVMDITGRILSTENIQNCYSKSLNLSAGVYVVRLSNGNDVKAQKIVVE